MSLPTTCRIRITGQKFLLNRQLHGLWHTNVVHKFSFVKDVWRWFLVWKEKFWYLINLTQSSDSTRWVTFNLILRHIPSIPCHMPLFKTKKNIAIYFDGWNLLDFGSHTQCASNLYNYKLFEACQSQALCKTLGNSLDIRLV